MIDLSRELRELEFEERMLFKEHAELMDRMLDQEDPKARDFLLRQCEFLASKIRSILRRIESLDNYFFNVA